MAANDDKETHVWRAIEQLRERFEEHAVKHAEIGGRLDGHDQAFATIQTMLEQNRVERQQQYTETRETLRGINETVSAVNVKVNEAHGATRFAKWAIATLMTAVALAIAYFKSGGDS